MFIATQSYVKVSGVCSTQARRLVGLMMGPTAATDAQGSNCDIPVVQPVAYVTRPEVMVVHVVF